MNMFIFVAVMCMGQKCDFITTHRTVTESHCQQIKRDFLALPFKPEVTVAAAQCMEFEDNKVRI
jgi:hypothetical protein